MADADKLGRKAIREAREWPARPDLAGTPDWESKASKELTAHPVMSGRKEIPVSPACKDLKVSKEPRVSKAPRVLSVPKGPREPKVFWGHKVRKGCKEFKDSMVRKESKDCKEFKVFWELSV